MIQVDAAEVEAALDKVRPAIQSDGGDVQVTEITEDGVVHLHLLGACDGCPSSMMTLKMGIERVLMDLVPGVTGVDCA